MCLTEGSGQFLETFWGDIEIINCKSRLFSIFVAIWTNTVTIWTVNLSGPSDVVSKVGLGSSHVCGMESCHLGRNVGYFGIMHNGRTILLYNGVQHVTM